MRASHVARLLVPLCLLALPGPVRGMSFCMGYQTLSQGVRECPALVYGVLKQPDPKAGQSSKEVIITDIIKNHPLVGGIKIVQLPEELPWEAPKNPPHYLLFCTVEDGQIEPYRAERATTALATYLKGLLALGPGNPLRRLRYCFEHLEHIDKTVALDAYHELHNCPWADLGRAARTFSPVKLRRLLQAPATPAERLPFYSLLLGCCGKEADAPLLRKRIDRHASEKAPNVFDEMLVGYTLLRPKDGRALAHSLLKQPLRPFMVRYSVVKMARFFYEARPGALSREQAIDLVRATLDQPDINDIGIEYLRRWRCWKLCEDVLSAPCSAMVSRRAVLRYALQCPSPKAAAFVARVRKQDAELVEDVEDVLEMLRLQDLAAQAGAK